MAFNKIIGIIGPKGSGKTHEICEFLRADPAFACYVIFRNDSEYFGIVDEIITENPRKLAEAMKAPQFRLIYHPAIPTVQDGEFTFPSFNLFVETCFRRGNMTMVVDEAHLLCDAKSCPPWLLMSLIDGRRRQLNIIYVSHRFSTVSRMLTANTDEFWFWRITESSDLDEIRKRCGSETMEKVKTLKRLELTPQGVVPGEMIRWSTYNGIEEGQAKVFRNTQTPDMAAQSGDADTQEKTPGEDRGLLP